jgi:tetratricopeptide (TPR) repeat protein
MTSSATIRLVFTLSCLAAASCEKSEDAKPKAAAQKPAPPPVAPASPPSMPRPAAGLLPAPSPLPERAPLPQKELSTTDGDIAIGNLEGSLQSAQTMAQSPSGDAIAKSGFISLLCVHGQYRGVLADYQRAEDLLPALMKLDAKEARSYLTRAQVRSIFHEFDAAHADLTQAEKLDKGVAPLVMERRASLLAAADKLDEALPIYHDIASRRPDVSTLGAEAALLGQRGELAAAEALFIKAQRHFRDVTPFPLAWLYFQHGLMWEQHDNLARAHELYAAAVERLPSYAAAVAHLAGAETARGRRDAAIALLRPLVGVSDDPEYKGQLAALLEQSGDVDGAKRLLAEAKGSYQLLLARHPRAFAAHAARFYLGPAKDPKSAMVWAEKNLAFLTTNDSLALAVEVSASANKSEQACALAEKLIKRPYLLPRAHVLAARAFLACGKKDLADAELGAVKAPAAP